MRNLPLREVRVKRAADAYAFKKRIKKFRGSPSEKNIYRRQEPQRRKRSVLSFYYRRIYLEGRSICLGETRSRQL